MFYFFYKIIIFIVNKEKDGLRSAYCKRDSMGLTVNRQMAKNLTVNRQKGNIFTVSRQMRKPILAVKCLRYSL